MPTSEEIAWAAGLFEGEGSMHLLAKTSGRLTITMADRDVLECFQRIAGGVGTIGVASRRNRPPQWKECSVWHLNRGDEVRRLVLLFLPWFGERRGAKAGELLQHMEGNLGPHAKRTHCMHGHELTEENTYHWEKRPNHRSCRQCHRERAARYYHERDRSPEKEARRRAASAERQRRSVARKKAVRV